MGGDDAFECLAADCQLPAALAPADAELHECPCPLGELGIPLRINHVVHQVTCTTSGWCLERDVVPRGVVVDQPPTNAQGCGDFGLGVRDT